MENKVKEWSVGSYVVFIKEGYMGSGECLKNNSKSTIGFVGEISYYYKYSPNLTAIKNNPMGNHVFEKYLVKWFATLQEAEIFSRSLLNNNIPEYVKCISYFDNDKKGKIYNTTIDKPENLTISWKGILIDSGRLKDGSFIKSTKEAYEAQFKQYPLTKGECYSSEIEVGDEVSSGNLTGIVIGIKNNGECNYLVRHSNSFKGHQGHPKIFTLLKGNYSDKNDSWYYALSSLKLIKKASQTTNSVKKVLSSSPEVGTTNEIYIPKITKTKPKVDFTITNNTFAEIKFNHSVKPKKVVKPIIIEKFQLSI